MSETLRSWKSKLAMLIGGVAFAGYLIFGGFGNDGGPLNTGVKLVTAQPSGTQAGTSGVAMPSAIPAASEATTPYAATAAQMSAAEADMAKGRAAMQARAAALPAGDPRVPAAVPQASSTATVARAATPFGAGPLADNTATFFHTNQLNPASGGLNSSSINEPAVAQNGRFVFETWNWGAARSTTGGNTWSYINPYSTMADFCCDQDVIYDKGRDRMFWLRQGLSGSFASPLGGVENRDLITVDSGAANLCTYDIRPSITGLPLFANSWFDYPQLALSNNFLYVHTNVFSNAGAFVSHFVIRFGLTEMAGCATAPFTWWQFTDGWTGALTDGAREVMYLGDTIVTNSTSNNTFRVNWFFESDTNRYFVDRTIPAYSFTNGNASCPVPGGLNPCARADQRITGAVLSHNTPLPNNTGAGGDKIDFYWNVRQGGSFTLPYVEAAGFFADSLAISVRKFIWNSSVTFFYAAAGVNDRAHVGLSLFQFNPVATGQNPYSLVGIDDDYNSRPPGWELYVTGVSEQWTTNASGDYLRARSYSPIGTAWIGTGVTRTGGQYVPSYTVFGRGRDLNGFNRFDQQ